VDGLRKDAFCLELGFRIGGSRRVIFGNEANVAGAESKKHRVGSYVKRDGGVR